MNRLLLIGALGFAVLMAVTTPWDGGESEKAKFIASWDRLMGDAGASPTLRECVSDGIERQFTEGEGALANRAMDGKSSSTAFLSGPAPPMVLQKIDRAMMACPGAGLHLSNYLMGRPPPEGVPIVGPPSAIRAIAAP